MSEQWRAIPGLGGLYEVSDLGRVRSLRFREPRLLSPRLHSTGLRYPRIELVDHGGVRRGHFVHVLVAAAFIGPKPVGMEVRHLDGNPQNAMASNLAYGTRSQNMLDAVLHGTHHMARRAKCARGHSFPSAPKLRADGGGRRCQKCERENALAYKRRRALASIA